MVFLPRIGSATFRSLFYGDWTPKIPMELITDNACPMRVTRPDLATALSNSERVLYRANVDVGAKAPSFETVLPKPAVMASSKTAPSSLEHVMAARTIMKGNKNMAGTVVERNYDATDYNLEIAWKPVVKPSFDMRSNFERALVDPGVVSKTNVEAIVENCFTKCKDTLQSQIVKAVKCTLEGALQASYFNSIEGLK